ncbi:uncharacterized protein LOC122510138 [Leptopilina heterotoma]|uniref:uncharacterized protein LOC122510138 n=1 Tax=Leptopilina heterotoma TaxID=63436 RepID=UPI001CA7C4F7|nr:uncharacterized protein LOC122510138 [Leptopilina heterotoma]
MEEAALWMMPQRAYRNIKTMLFNEGYNLTDFQGLLDIQDEIHTQQVNDIIDYVLDALKDSSFDGSKCLYVDGCGGSGKTFLYITLWHLLRSNGINVCNMAFTGIATTLLPNGKTVHKVLGLPVPLYSDSSSNIKVQSKEGLYLKNMDVFIWDEAPMAPKYALEIMDYLLRDIMNSNEPFGDFLLKIGNGELNDADDNVILPEHIIQEGNVDIAEEMYSQFIQQNKFEEMSECAILAPRNVDVDDINKRVVRLLDSKAIMPPRKATPTGYELIDYDKLLYAINQINPARFGFTICPLLKWTNGRHVDIR